MPWHLSKSDLRKVYDSFHQTVCVCHTAEQAAMIVDAMRARGESAGEAIRLREPVIQTPAVNDYLDSFEPDECCGKSLTKAANEGVLKSLTRWSCPKCGADWEPRMVGPVRHWSLSAPVAIFRARA